MYQFAGFFAKPPIEPPATLPSGVVWRAISAPFAGIGVRVSSLIGQSPQRDEVEILARKLSLLSALEVLYLTYDCWGGGIDYVYGLGVREDTAFGPVEESDVTKTKQVYLTLMNEFGVSPDDALRFPPFVRGFWGEF